MRMRFCLAILAVAAVGLFAAETKPAISGDYLEARSCDVYTGSCFANSEMNLTGKEAMMVWFVREGAWKGAKLDGLSVMAVVQSDGTLGDLKYDPRSAEAVLIVDAKADAKQHQALADFARSMAGKLISKVMDVKSAPIEASIATCTKQGCASVKAGDLVKISTSCLGGKHDVCGNEETFYPPLTQVNGAYPVFTDVATYTGSGLNATWQIAGKRSSFLATFAAEEKAGSSVQLSSRR